MNKRFFACRRGRLWSKERWPFHPHKATSGWKIRYFRRPKSTKKPQYIQKISNCSFATMSYIHSAVVSSKLDKPIFSNGKQTSRHRWRLKRFRWVTETSGPVSGRQPFPEKVQLPIEPSTKISWDWFERKVHQIDVVYDWTCQSFGIGLNLFQQGFQPSWFNFTMTVQENKNIALGNVWRFQPRPN